jgi:thiol-disulfide isomerase/thioredoxin
LKPTPSKITLLLALGILLPAGAAINVGDQFPDLAAAQLTGKLPDNLAGKVVLVDFWASWCAPCVRSFPVMDALQKKYGPQGFVVIAVSEDDSQADLDQFVKKHPVSFTVVHDVTQKLVAQADILTMPGSFLLGRNGKVAFVHHGFNGDETKNQYISEIENLLK